MSALTRVALGWAVVSPGGCVVADDAPPKDSDKVLDTDETDETDPRPTDSPTGDTDIDTDDSDGDTDADTDGEAIGLPGLSFGPNLITPLLGPSGLTHRHCDEAHTFSPIAMVRDAQGSPVLATSLASATNDVTDRWASLVLDGTGTSLTLATDLPFASRAEGFSAIREATFPPDLACEVRAIQPLDVLDDDGGGAYRCLAYHVRGNPKIDGSNSFILCDGPATGTEDALVTLPNSSKTPSTTVYATPPGMLAQQTRDVHGFRLDLNHNGVPEQWAFVSSESGVFSTDPDEGVAGYECTGGTSGNPYLEGCTALRLSDVLDMTVDDQWPLERVNGQPVSVFGSDLYAMKQLGRPDGGSYLMLYAGGANTNGAPAPAFWQAGPTGPFTRWDALDSTWDETLTITVGTSPANLDVDGEQVLQRRQPMGADVAMRDGRVYLHTSLNTTNPANDASGQFTGLETKMLTLDLGTVDAVRARATSFAANLSSSMGLPAFAPAPGNAQLGTPWGVTTQLGLGSLCVGHTPDRAIGGYPYQYPEGIGCAFVDPSASGPAPYHRAVHIDGLTHPHYDSALFDPFVVGAHPDPFRHDGYGVCVTDLNDDGVPDIYGDGANGFPPFVKLGSLEDDAPRLITVQVRGYVGDPHLVVDLYGTDPSGALRDDNPRWSVSRDAGPGCRQPAGEATFVLQAPIADTNPDPDCVDVHVVWNDGRGMGDKDAQSRITTQSICVGPTSGNIVIAPPR